MTASFEMSACRVESVCAAPIWVGWGRASLKNASGVGRSHVDLGLACVVVSLAISAAASDRRVVMLSLKPWLVFVVFRRHFMHSGRSDEGGEGAVEEGDKYVGPVVEYHPILG